MPNHTIVIAGHTYVVTAPNEIVARRIAAANLAAARLAR